MSNRTIPNLQMIQLSSSLLISKAKAIEILPDVETALFFAKAYDLNYEALSTLLRELFNTNSVVEELLKGDHSTELQDYIIDTIPDEAWVSEERPGFSPDVPTGELLPQLWESITIDVASSIKEVASKLGKVLSHLPSKNGEMTFQTLMMMNRQRPTLGAYMPSIKREMQGDVLVILDVSGSMTEKTIRTIVDDVVALSYTANAHLAIVSNSAFMWTPGSFDSDDVLHAAEFGGTHYEKLVPYFDQDWSVVVTIADYDSSASAQRVFSKCTGRVGEVLDISLVNLPTHLAACVGTLADKVTPLLIGDSYRPL